VIIRKTLHGNTWSPPKKPTWILFKKNHNDKNECNKNSKNKLKTGILLYALSAAYDTMCPSLFCEKLKVYGFNINTCKWFVSILIGGSHRVKIGISISNSMKLVSGVPQGGILSIIIFVIYGADMEEWIKHSSIYLYMCK